MLNPLNRYRPIKTKADAGHWSFHCTDSKRRRIGYAWEITEVHLELMDDQTSGGSYVHAKDFGLHYFELWTHMTRNGKIFGPMQGRKLFQTLEQARVAAGRRVDAAEKRSMRRLDFIKD